MTVEKPSGLGFQRTDVKSGSISFDANVYSVTSLKKALYKFAADFSANLSSDGDRLDLLIQFETDDSQAQEKLLRALCNELIDQDLRERIATETEATRNIILAEAFSKTSLLGKD